MLLDEKLQLSDQELVNDFLQNVCQKPQTVQEQTLLDIITTNRDTAFGRQHDFANIQSAEDFVNRVPIQEWTGIESLATKMEQGEKDVLFAGQPVYFIVTSGTTGKPKFLPESILGAKAKGLTTKLKTALLISKKPASLAGKFFPISNSAGVGKVACGIPYGYASGVTLMETPKEMREKIAFPLEILNIKEQADLDYALMRFAVEQNVTAIVGNNAGRMEQLILMAQEKAEQIIDDIEKGTISINDTSKALVEENCTMTPNPEKAAQLRTALKSGVPFLPSSYWPALDIFSTWMGGSIGQYLPQIKPLLGDDICYMDFGYGASEGKFNIPLVEEEPAGVLSLLAAFYEFGSIEEPDKIVQAHQLEDGKQYTLLVTTFSGLYRYNLHDIVEVRGFTGNSPNICFVSKTKDVGNISGEKLSALFLSQAVRNVCGALGLSLKHCAVVPNVQERQYQFCLEFAAGEKPSPDFVAELDKALEVNTIYATKRTQGLLTAPALYQMKTDWLDAVYGLKAGNSAARAQIKLPVIYDEIPCPEYVLSKIQVEI